MAGRAPKVRHLRPPGGPLHFAIVAARFNERMSQRLVEGALEAFRRAGVARDAVEVHWVPGSFELPQAAGHLAATDRYDGVVCVGVVIRGQTPHFEHVAREAAAGIRHVALTTGVPVGFGVVTALSEEQAWARAGGEVGNRGEEAAEAALEMAAWIRRLPGDRASRRPATPARSARPPEPRAPRDGRASRSPAHLSQATRGTRRARGPRSK